ncbi:MAG: indolepyruvate oxidoreductase subunit B [Bordetella sp. SCN 68-11]|nr:MAG: indolepyruvate oxidoreductase subunit B [Bordetella sp. SCN 68-11]
MDVAAATDWPIAIAIMAMGGQGGGVLADWIVALAEAQGWVAQATSVPGVAQRTGATIYYVEIIRAVAGRQPVLSLMPVPGDVDVVIAAELMEAGRAVQRGLVTPDRTVLLASSHRSLAMVEKIKPGDGIADPAPVLAAAGAAAKRFVHADMQALAERAGSVISAALFGALAASGALPFARAAFEETIRAAGVGVAASLAAFALGYDAVRSPVAAAAPAPVEAVAVSGGTAAEQAAFARALQRVAAFPEPARAMLGHGLRRVVDYQDVAYGHEYLDIMDRLLALDSAAENFALTAEAARQVAVALAYDDVIRVADLKTRASRFARVRGEVVAGAGEIVETTEFMHPRMAELCATMPARWGLAVERSRLLTAALRWAFERRRRVRTTTVLGFVPLYLVAGLRPRRRTLLRHQREMAHVRAWLALVERHAPGDCRLAVELLKCRRLVKGYSDTHARGASKFDRVTGAVALLAGRDDAADWIRRLRDAALADAEGKLLDGALATIRTL